MEIEIYEWKPGARRPGTKRKVRHDILEVCSWPDSAPAPQIGDLLWIMETGSEDGPTPFRVMAREHLVTPMGGGEDVTLRWTKMWIAVRRLSFDEAAKKP